MIVKTITCHDVYNVGASLQAYALETYLVQLGHDVEIIDYKPKYLSGHFPLWGVNNKRYDKIFLKELYCLAKFPVRLKNRYGKRKREFDNFTKKYLKVTDQIYHSSEELKANLPEADVFFAGSDQIWNTFFKNGKDPAFYLDFVPAGRIKASYAASFATDYLMDGYEDFVANLLKKFDYISVRESSGLLILKELGIMGGIQVLDPVFLLGQDIWRILASNWKNREKKPYILVYDFDNSEKIADFVKEIAKEHDWNIISILENPYFKKNYSKEGPIAFLSLIKNAQAIVSNSFHATAFSIIFEKEFWVFNRNEEINTRMKDLLVLLGLENQLNLKEIHGKIDYKKVNKKLEKAIITSKEYISKVLEGKVRNEKN